jgi:hypothetical protein
MYLYARARAHKSNIKATLCPSLKIYNYLCGQALELKLFYSKKKLKVQKIKLSVHVQPPTTEKVMHVFLSSELADFILITFQHLDYL